MHPTPGECKPWTKIFPESFWYEGLTLDVSGDTLLISTTEERTMNLRLRLTPRTPARMTWLRRDADGTLHRTYLPANCPVPTGYTEVMTREA
jgi:hypothetical protein